MVTAVRESTPALQENLKTLIEDGYVLLKNVIPKNLISEMKNLICEKLVKFGASPNVDFAEQYAQASKKIYSYKINMMLRRSLICDYFPIRLLTIPEILDLYVHTIGPDLAYDTTNELPVIVKDEESDALVKKFHQEFWSGAGYRTYSFWAPIILAKGAGTMDMIRKSHEWGHIPHQNREPRWLPDDAEIVNLQCEEGDAIIFSSLTIHRTVPNTVDCPRLAYSTQVRNIFEAFSGFDMLRGFEVFHSGAATEILKKCGNPHLSPFRIYDSPKRPDVKQYGMDR